MSGSEESARKFEDETIKVMDDVYNSEEFKEETQKFFSHMDQTFRNCQDKCGENENCMQECAIEFFKGAESEMQELDEKMFQCESKCDPKGGPERFKCFKQCSFGPLVRIAAIMNLQMLAEQSQNMPPN